MNVMTLYNLLGKRHDWVTRLFLTSGAKRAGAVRHAGIGPGDSVLEVGSGTGANFRYIWERVAPNGSITALDFSTAMQDAARRRVAETNWRVEFATHDAATFESKTLFDCVYFGQSFNTLPHHRDVLANVWGLLRPGGKLVVFDSAFFGRHADLMRVMFGTVVRYTVGADVWIKPWEEVQNFLQAQGIEAPIQCTRLGRFHYVFVATKPRLNRVSPRAPTVATGF